jgi:hypothetical protein
MNLKIVKSGNQKKAERRAEIAGSWRLADRSQFGPGTQFRTSDQAAYKVAGCGAFVRTNKDHRSKKERTRARRQQENRA